jgi:hypothetical protein
MALKQTLADVIDPVIFERLHPKAQKLAKESKIPRHDYIALQIPKNESTRDGTGRWMQSMTAGIMWLNLDDQPDQKSQLDDQINSRYGRIIAYGNFPTHDHPDKAIREKYRHYGEGENENPWDKMAKYCEVQLGNATIINTRYNMLEQAIEEQKAKAEALEAENKALKEAMDDKKLAKQKA